MDSDRKPRENIVLHKDRHSGEDCIRVDHARSQALASLLAQDADVVAVGDGCAYIPAAAFHLSDFYDRYSPHAYIDYSRVYVRHPKPNGNMCCRKATWICWNRNVTAPPP